MRSTRREFMQQLAVFSAMGFAPQFVARAAAAEANAIQGFKDDRVLVVVQLGGGNDGLNTVVPYGDDEYYRARPKLGLKADSLLRIDDYVAMNSSMTGMKDLYDNGKLAIIQGSGYPNPDRSHFRSMEIWHTASDSDEFMSRGWIGRYFDNQCSGSARPQAGMAIDSERPQAFEGERGFGIATTTPKEFGWDRGELFQDDTLFTKMNAAAGSANGTLDFLRHTTLNASTSSEQVRMAADKGKVHAANRYNQLDTVAGLIRGGLETRVYYVSTSGFDTHAGQLAAHGNLWSRVSKALADFQAQLEKDGTADRVTTLVFSEFGRRVGENASGGTDHGTAAPVFLMGKGIRPGLHGKAPSLTDLDHGDLKFTTDFRSIYASVLENWFEADSKTILGHQFDTLPIIA
ncbi:MAG: DUF1501 domain-containing protein [Candidatus Hydrogenedens sp.]|nr:DUF1501 domain-containing protein [Candidatus Hydrogenedens sp.]